LNFFVLKYVILIGGILASTALVAGPVEETIFHDAPVSEENISPDSIYLFGSGVFYKEIDKPGNEYMKSSVEGYSRNLVQDEEDVSRFDASWNEGVRNFKNGYSACNDAYIKLSGVPSIGNTAGKNVVWEQMRAGKEDIARSSVSFNAAKSFASPGSSIGFTIGMALPRIEQVRSSAEDAELATMKAILADRDHDNAGFEKHLKEAGVAIKEMKRIYPELRALSKDF